MYNETKGSTRIEVTGIPMFLPKQPPKYQIGGYNLSKEKQMWYRTPLPEDWEEMREEEKEIQNSDPYYVNQKLEDFRIQEWNRRINGYWFFNYNPKTKESEPTYVTGKHYFYLNWCKLDHPGNDGYPFYRDTDRLEFYFTEFCFQAPWCLGYFKVSGRGTGKSSKECAICIEEITKPPHRRQAYIQARNLQEAKGLFKDKLVEIYKELPDFFQPESNHGSNPEGKLSFFRDAVKGKNAKKVKQDDSKELKNIVMPVPATAGYLDGKTAAFIMGDEIGKADPKEQVDVEKRLQINIFSVFRDNIKRGIIGNTSTIEEMENGGAEARRIFFNSDYTQRSENGFTKSRLLKYFTSALDTHTITYDGYGRPDREVAKKYHDAERKGLASDPNGLASYIRKNPYTPEEAFMTNSDKCLFNAMILEAAKTRNMEAELDNRPLVIRGDFVWSKEIDGDVKWQHNDKNGRWKISCLPAPEKRNQINRERNYEGKPIFEPLQDELFAISTDPVSHSEVIDEGKKSMAAAHIYRKPDYWEKNDLLHDTWVAQYYGRPDPEEYGEDMIRACIFWGCSILIENNKINLINHFNSRGYRKFVMRRPAETYTESGGKAQDTQGAPSSTPTIEIYINKLISWINRRGHTILFNETIDHLLEFSVKKKSQFDLAVSAGWSLVAADRPVQKKSAPQIAATQLFDRYKINGTQSKRI